MERPPQPEDKQQRPTPRQARWRLTKQAPQTKPAWGAEQSLREQAPEKEPFLEAQGRLSAEARQPQGAAQFPPLLPLSLLVLLEAQSSTQREPRRAGGLPTSRKDGMSLGGEYP